MRKHWISKGLQIIAILAAVMPIAVNAQEFNLSPSFASRALALQIAPWQGEPQAFAQTGPVPAQGGERQSSLRDTPTIAGLSAHMLYGVASAAGLQTHSQASLNSLEVRIGPHEITALWVLSEATATAGFLNVRTSGKTTIQGLTVDGQAVTVTGAANQTISFPDGFLVINEQTGSGTERMGAFTVNALHLLVDGAGSVVAGSSTVEIINAPTRVAAP